MSEFSGAQLFQQLPAEAQARHLSISQQMARRARDHAVPIIFAPPLGIPGKINGACGCVVRLAAGTFVVSASHVLAGYEERTLSGEVLNWQVGNLPPFDPVPRVAWRDSERDIVLLRISEDEARRLGPCTISCPLTWPPCPPQEGQLVLAAGYPKALREEDAASGRIGAGPYSALFRVTIVGVGYCKCLVERKDLISFNGGPLPEPGTEMGGLSGGPVLLAGDSSYPLVGIITHRWEMSSAEAEIIKFATLEHVIVENQG
jgi:hypothetical protein